MIIVNLDVMLAKRKMKSNELADKIGITTANLSISRQARPKPFASPPLKPSAKNLTASLEIFWNTAQMNSSSTKKCNWRLALSTQEKHSRGSA